MNAKTLKYIDNEKGAALLVALMVLTLIALLAMTLFQNTTIELQIVRNDTEKKQQFYLAEAASREAAQEVENMSSAELMDAGGLNWINTAAVDLAALDLSDAIWNKSGVDNSPAGTVEIGYTVVETSGWIDLSQATSMHTYTIMGVYDIPSGMRRGQSVVEIGYKRRF
jgi:Tfp pilus assembly protein PilX